MVTILLAGFNKTVVSTVTNTSFQAYDTQAQLSTIMVFFVESKTINNMHILNANIDEFISPKTDYQSAVKLLDMSKDKTK